MRTIDRRQNYRPNLPLFVELNKPSLAPVHIGSPFKGVVKAGGSHLTAVG